LIERLLPVSRPPPLPSGRAQGRADALARVLVIIDDEHDAAGIAKAVHHLFGAVPLDGLHHILGRPED